MGKASRRRKESKGKPQVSTRAATSSENERLDRVLGSIRGRQLSLAAGLFMGYSKVATGLQNGTARPWHHRCDPLDLLFLGMCLGDSPEDEATFANARDTWLDVLRENRQWPAVAELLEHMLAVSDRMELPIDTPPLFLELSADLSGAARCMEALPLSLHPTQALAEHRSIVGIHLRERLPEPTAESRRAAEGVWALAAADAEVPHDRTPADAVRTGLRTLTSAGLEPEDHDLVLLALYVGYAEAEEAVSVLRGQAQAWAGGLAEGAAVTAVADLAWRAMAQHIGSQETLARLMTLPQAQVPAEPNQVAWRSEVGIAAAREALALRPGTRVRVGEDEHIALGGVASAVLDLQKTMREAQLGRRLRDDDLLFDPADMGGELPFLEPLKVAGISAASLHAAQATGLMPPGPSGFANASQEQEWDAAVEDFFDEHPEHEDDYDPEHDADISATMVFTMGLAMATINPPVGAATIAEIRKDPDGEAATMTLRTSPTATRPVLGPALVNAAKEHARAFDGPGLARDIEAAAALLAANVDGFTEPDTVREGRLLAPALYCLAVAAAARTPR